MWFIFVTFTGIIYKTQRAEMILEYRERPPLPNPVSLLYFFYHVSKFLYRRYIKKINYEKDLQKMSNNLLIIKSHLSLFLSIIVVYTDLLCES